MSHINLNERVIQIKDDIDETNKLIQEYKPFISSVVNDYVSRYVKYGQDDELSIGLIAFNEAIQKYDINKGNFLSFARMIIKHRLIDYYRKEQKSKKEIMFTHNKYNGNIEQAEETLCFRESLKEYKQEELSQLRRAEIFEIKNELAQFGISFLDVAKSSPKHKSTKNTYRSVIKFIIQSPEILNVIKTKKYLPISKIVDGTKITRKRIERGRNYIIAAVLILTGDYQYIQDYVQWG